MNTQILEYIIAISEEKNMTRAADRLLVSQPALSRQVKNLEGELGTPVFYRKKNEMLLTDAGKIYVNGARSVLNIYEHALEEIAQIRTSGRKSITMVYNNALLPIFSTEIMPMFRNLHGDIRLSTIIGNASVAKDYLINGLADLAVVATGEPTHSMLEYIPLRDDELMLALPAAHPCARRFQKNGVDLHLLQKEHFILNQVNSYFRMLEQEIFSNAFLPIPNVISEISDLNTSLNMVANHKGIAFLPKSMIHGSSQCLYFPLDPPARFHIVIAYQKGINLTKPIRDLIMLMLKAYP